MKEERIPVSHTLKESLRKELKQFSKYSYRSESQIIEQALERYFQSDRAFQDLMKVEAEKAEFFKGLKEDADFRSVVTRDLLIK